MKSIGRFLKRFRFLVRPLWILILAQICWGLLMFVWIRWYILSNTEIEKVLARFQGDSQFSGHWVILAQGCLLMAFILVALYVIYLSHRRLVGITKMQDTVLNHVTHELKTPLAVIRLYIETLMLRKVTDPEKDLFLKRALGEANRLQKLIDTILVSARFRQEKFFFKVPRNMQTFLLTSALTPVVQRMQERFGQERIFLYTIQPEAGTCLIRGYQDDVAVLFENLLDNAVKYTQKNDLIEIFVAVKNKNAIEVNITDHGIGLLAKDCKKIFKRFYRVQNTHKAPVGGSGLGLWVCASIAKEHQAELYAKSPGLGKGSSFYVEFKTTPADC